MGSKTYRLGVSIITALNNILFDLCTPPPPTSYKVVRVDQTESKVAAQKRIATLKTTPVKDKMVIIVMHVNPLTHSIVCNVGEGDRSRGEADINTGHSSG